VRRPDRWWGVLKSELAQFEHATFAP
jgi:hypothetical protein